MWYCPTTLTCNKCGPVIQLIPMRSGLLLFSRHVLAADTFWIGDLLNSWAENWIYYWTVGQGSFAMGGFEDAGMAERSNSSLRRSVDQIGFSCYVVAVITPFSRKERLQHSFLRLKIQMAYRVSRKRSMIFTKSVALW